MLIIDQVANIMKVSRAARNNDKDLFIIYMQLFGMQLSSTQVQKFREMPSFETIRRRRQILQERGLYPADDSVNEQRYQNYKAIQGGDLRLEAPSQPVVLLRHDSELYKEAMRAFPE